MKRTLLFIACVLASVTMQAQDYLPFVEKGKSWHVVRSDFDSGTHLEKYMLLDEGIVKDGKTYLKMYRSEDDLAVVYDMGLFREENRKVYYIDRDMQEEHLIFDYSLKAGDTYETYSYDDGEMVTYKVLSVSDYKDGPEVVCKLNDEQTDTLQHRYLRKWTLCRTDIAGVERTWIEGIGSLGGPLENLSDVVLPGMTKDYLAYVENDDYLYLPFSFSDTMNGQVYGCNLPTGAADHSWVFQHQLTYELEGDRLHVYGKAFLNCGTRHYAFFHERKTDDPMVRKIEFFIEEVGEFATCESLFATDFYVPGFDPNLDYIVVDNQGEEHPVINKTQQVAYRPFIEEGKVWKVGGMYTGNPVLLVKHFYFEGDTIIDGRTCKKMMSQLYINPDIVYVADPNFHSAWSEVLYSAWGPLKPEGAWYEEDKKVYRYDPYGKQFELMYDFSVNAYGPLSINDISYEVGPRQTGILTGFKGVFREVWMCLDGVPMYRSVPWLEGVGGIYGPTVNVIDGQLADEPAWFLMSCTVGDEVIYLNEEYEDGASPDVMGARKRIDFTHTIKTRPKMPRKEPATGQEEGSLLYGEYNDLQLGINLNPLDDAYQVCITDETGKAVYEKNVNAGNIVGLNIDISTYAEGRYTVTVENGQESFTGVFETITTGISDTARLNDNGERIDDNIYNLQGQRLNTLQKGLNILNGHKVYVK